MYDVSRNLISTGNTTNESYDRATVNTKNLLTKDILLKFNTQKTPSYKPITNITAINFVDGTFIANINFTDVNTIDLWVVYKNDDKTIVNENLTFYASKLDTK